MVEREAKDMMEILESGAGASAVTVADDGQTVVRFDNWVTQSPDRDELPAFIAAEVQRMRLSLADGGEGPPTVQ